MMGVQETIRSAGYMAYGAWRTMDIVKQGFDCSLEYS